MGQNIQSLNGGFMPEGETQNCKLQVLFHVWPTTVKSPQYEKQLRRLWRKPNWANYWDSLMDMRKKSVKEVSSDDSKKYLA